MPPRATTPHDSVPADPIPAAPSGGGADRLRAILGVPRLFPPGRVAVLRLHGPIRGSGRTADWVELVRRVRESSRIPAVVLDVDSGGGSAAAADDLFLALERLAVRKPLVAAIRGVGASGAYLAAMAARRVIANPNAIVGSIGVISIGPRLPALLDRAGISVSVTKAGRLKEMGAPWRMDTEEETAKEQELVDAYYDAFVARVAAGRGLDPDRVRELATGEVWLGRTALELGLVDEIGDLERAIEIAAAQAHVPARGAPVRLRRPFFSQLTDRFASRAAGVAVAEVEALLADRRRF